MLYFLCHFSDVDECANKEMHGCDGNAMCVNEKPGYKCNCHIGSKLDNTGRSCRTCPNDSWGIDCNMSCACSTAAASRCDPVSGCVCNPGYTGTHCEANINQCLNKTCGAHAECIDQPGIDACQCMPGYRNINTSSESSLQCQDIDECAETSLNDCDQKCNNVDGGYNCTCYAGYHYDSTLRKCVDINECEFKTSKCSHICNNKEGNYSCDCPPGFRLDQDGHTCKGTSQKIVTITLDYTVTENVDWNNQTSKKYTELKTATEQLLYNVLTRVMKDLVSVTVTKMWSGSLHVDTDLLVSGTNSASSIAQGLTALYKARDLALLDQHVTVTNVTVGGQPFHLNGSLCQRREEIEKCLDGQVCEEEGGTCRLVVDALH
ncbi:unnamed protein product [Lymnaea stagnalis]|uniref:EGF-like domain-containing protein n=1 Tax=Lymnaea stagnalis TaxID=6523 RepID=A0AAV2HTM4_LYMST